MIEIYIALIRAGKRTLEQVPENIRAAVEARLNQEAA
jgi:hypothetical protein